MHSCFHPSLQIGVQSLTEDEAVHVSRVLRMKVGDDVRLINGMGASAIGQLLEVGKRKASVSVESLDIQEAERPKGLMLVVAPTKSNDRFEWLLEKATELGVESIWPVWTSRSERRIDKHERWEKVLVAATKQSQRLWKPSLQKAVELSVFLGHAEALGHGHGAVAHCIPEMQGLPERVDWKQWQIDKGQAWLAIGPEGDFTLDEVGQMVAVGAQPVHLGEHRLRTETAGMAAVAQFFA